QLAQGLTDGFAVADDDGRGRLVAASAQPVDEDRPRGVGGLSPGRRGGGDDDGRGPTDAEEAIPLGGVGVRCSAHGSIVRPRTEPPPRLEVRPQAYLKPAPTPA